MAAIEHIREEERKSHEELYTNNRLFQNGSWLVKPVKNIIENLSYFKQYDRVNILDLGCGVGRNSIAAAKYLSENNIDCNIDCVDLLEVAIEQIKEYAAEYEVQSSITAYLSAIDEFEIRQNTYDYVIAAYALEHVADKKTFIDILKRIHESVVDKGLVCLMINSQLHERDIDTKKEREALFEVNLPTRELQNILHETFKNWTVIDENIRYREWIAPREGREVLLDTNVVTYVIQNSNKRLQTI